MVTETEGLALHQIVCENLILPYCKTYCLYFSDNLFFLNQPLAKLPCVLLV